MTRELTLTTVFHPEFIDNDWQLVRHPTVAPITDGEPTLGWEGDPRLAVYLHNPSKTFVLWRLEASGEYMPIGTFGLGNEITPASINQTIRRLIEVDSRRGFDPGADVLHTVEQAEKQAREDHLAHVSQVADRLLFGLSQSHLPGVDITYKHNLLAKGR